MLKEVDVQIDQPISNRPREDIMIQSLIYSSMKTLGLLFLLVVSACPCSGQSKVNSPAASPGAEQSVPEVLKPWIPWVLWDDSTVQSPPTYRDAEERIFFWPSQVDIQAQDGQGDWQVSVSVYRESWFPLPGGTEHWPTNVTNSDQEVVVVEHNGSPAVQLKPGFHSLKGQWQWKSMPQKIALPRSYGVLSLQVRGEPIQTPNWGSDGLLWLNRSTVGQVQQDSFSFEVYRLIQDGSPIWLRTEIDLTATGKSREEELGYVLPEGWQLSFVNSPIPVAIDDAGKLKAQLRAGNWKILIDAFRTEDLKALQYNSQTPPAKDSELVALEPAPLLRTVELQGVWPIDAQTTRFPQNWRSFTVNRWQTSTAATLVEKNRGMGVEKPNQLAIYRTLWLDDDGHGMTYQDILSGEPKQLTRIDVAKEHQLGVVRIQGQRQLITQNPETGSEGVELRIRKPRIEAVGRATNLSQIAATGWQTPADKLELTLFMPPGWRMLALFGADRVEGDWLTAWTLLDLFLLLVFSLAVLRLYGWIPGLVAFAAFALTYHEPGAPRWTWFFLLIPLALIRVIGPGKSQIGLQWWKHLASALLLLNLLPFAAIQIQNAIYPQLEPSNANLKDRTLFQWMEQTSNSSVYSDTTRFSGSFSSPLDSHPSVLPQTTSSMEFEKVAGRGFERSLEQANSVQTNQAQVGNFAYDPKTSIQTGIAKPQWIGTAVRCNWDGPVSDTQSIRPILISCNAHRALTLCRLVLLVVLLGILLDGLGRFWSQTMKVSSDAARGSTNPIACALLALGLVGCCGYSSIAQAQVPDSATLGTLRERVKHASDAFPNAADIPKMSLKILQNRLEIQATVHAATTVAVPLPGKGASWFPGKIQLDDKEAQVVRRNDDHLWVLVPEGIHKLSVQGRIVDTTEWSWAFILSPRLLEIDAPEWSWTGLGSDGIPERQIIFVRKEQLVEGQANYDQKNFRSVFLVERRLEIGLVWKVATTLRRLSQPGKAVSVSVPTLENEQIVTPGVVVSNGMIDVNFGAEQMQFEWLSELPVAPTIHLSAKPSSSASSTSNLIEKWLVEASPAWSMRSEGSKPIFDLRESNLVPEWNPWPGESLVLSFQRPSAVEGKLLTIQSLQHTMSVGSRQRKSSLTFDIESSLGGEQAIPLPQGSTVTDIRIDKRSVPIRRQGDQVLVNLQPGAQNVSIEWAEDLPIQSVVAMPAIEMPEEVANSRSQMLIPASRWILWAHGPQRGPAVRFWVILMVSILVAWMLGSRLGSPLATWEWMLLAIGLTQVHIVSSLLIVAWLFSINLRRRLDPNSMKWFSFNFLQVSNVILTIVAIGLLISVVTAGLLGSPRMFIVGNDSFEGNLNWFTPRSDKMLPMPWVLSVSIWYYRLLMLVWALWLANSLLHWLKEWWRSLVHGGGWRVWGRKPLQPELGHSQEINEEQQS